MSPLLLTVEMALLSVDYFSCHDYCSEVGSVLRFNMHGTRRWPLVRAVAYRPLVELSLAAMSSILDFLQ
jgi:hypothetical protein